MSREEATACSIWRQIERICLVLLQQKHTRSRLRQIHAFMLRNAIEANVSLFTKFVTACGSLPSLAGISYARRVFDVRPHRDDSFLCNSMIKCHLCHQQFAESFLLFKDLRKESFFVPDNFTFTTLAKACGVGMGIWEGLQIQNYAMKLGFCLDLYVSTSFVDMYAKFGDMGCARKLFDEMTERSVVSWTTLICGYAKSANLTEARKLFEEMPEKQDPVLYNALIDGYVKLGDVDTARCLFDEMPVRTVISWTSMIDGLCNSGNVASARLLFDAMPERNLVSWNAIIGGYTKNNQPHEALKLFREMQSSTSLEPDKVTIVSILPAIADLGALELGCWVHHFVRQKMFDREINVCTALIDMYAKCGDIMKAKRVFNEMPERETASWNALINGFAVNGCAKEALELFLKMQSEGFKPNDITMMGVLSACSHGGLVEEGKRWFKSIKEFRLVPKIEHYGCMVDLLGRAGHVEEAEKLITSMPYGANDIILSSFLFACRCSEDVERAERVLSKLVTVDPQNDGNYVMLRNLYATERRWEDVEEVKGVMRRNGARKEVGCSVIEVDGAVSEFVSGIEKHPRWETIQFVLKQLWMHMRGLGGYSELLATDF